MKVFIVLTVLSLVVLSLAQSAHKNATNRAVDDYFAGVKKHKNQFEPYTVNKATKGSYRPRGHTQPVARYEVGNCTFHGISQMHRQGDSAQLKIFGYRLYKANVTFNEITGSCYVHAFHPSKPAKTTINVKASHPSFDSYFTASRNQSLKYQGSLRKRDQFSVSPNQSGLFGEYEKRIYELISYVVGFDFYHAYATVLRKY